MNGINLTRVLLGGLAAGIVITLSEFVLWGFVLEGQYEAMLASYGLAEASWAMAGYVLGSLVLGFVLAFTYAAMRPRFGAGVKTAIIAGAAVWVAAYVLPMVWNGAVGISIGAAATVLTLAWALVELGLAASVAGMLYREQEAPAVATARTY